MSLISTRPVSVMATFVFVALFCHSAAYADQYRISFSTARADDDGALRKASVEATVTPNDGRIQLMRAGADTGLFHEWATFLLNIEAVDQFGNPLALEYEPPGRWRAPDWRSGPVTLRYDMLLQHDRFPNEPGDNELAAAHPYGVMWTTRALFVEGLATNDVTVEFDVPDGWRVTTPWQRLDSSLKFVPKDTDDLLDAAFLAGEHIDSAIAIGNVEARLAIGPPVSQAEDVFTPLLRAYLDSFSRLFGEPPGDNILLIALDASFLGGGVIGRSISLSIPVDADLGAARPIAAYIIAHEGFHLWNTRWDGSSDIEWLSEGAAEYYAYLTAVRLGHIDEDTFTSILSDRYLQYLRALEFGESIVSAADTKHTAGSSYDLIYSGGMIAALLIDLEVRNASGGIKSLDDVARRLQQLLSQEKSQSLTLDQLCQILETEFSFDFSPIADDSLRGSKPIQLASALERVGLAVSADLSNDAPTKVIVRTVDPTKSQHDAYTRWIVHP